MDIQELEVLDSAIKKAFDLSARERVLLKERVLTDFFGEKRVLEPFYLILVDVRLYLVPVKFLQMSVGTSLAKQPPRQVVLHHLAHLDRVKSIGLETRPPKLVIPLVEKILTLLIEIHEEPSAGAEGASQAAEQTLTATETDLRLDLSGLAPGGLAAAAVKDANAAPPTQVTSETPNEPTPPAPAAPDGAAGGKTVGCCGSSRASRNAAAAGADSAGSEAVTLPAAAPPPEPPVAPPSSRTVKIYLNYFRKSHPESDWAFQQLRSAWSKQVLKRTLHCDSDYLLLTTRRSAAQLSEADYRLLFEGLVADLERSVGDAAGLSDLLQELFVSLKRYFITKKLFWETPRLFELLVVNMEIVAKEQRSAEAEITEIERKQHGNQLRVLLHALQALNCSFEDTEALASRHRSLHQNDSRLIPILVGSLCSIILVADGRHTWGDDGEQEVMTEQVSIYRALLLERARTFYHLMAECSSHSGRQDELSPASLSRMAADPVNKPGFLAFVTDCLRHCARHFDFYGRVRDGAPVAQMRPETAVQLFKALDALRRILLTSSDAWSSARACAELLAENRHFLHRSRVAACLRRDLPLRDAFLVLADDLRRILQLHLADAGADAPIRSG